MNAIFGRAGASVEPDQHWEERIRDAHGQAVQWGARRPGLTVGTLEDGGCVLGCATSGDLWLAVLGSIHQPLAGWNGGSPLDDPNSTARFLLNRYRESGSRFLDGVLGQYAVAVTDASRDMVVLAISPEGLRQVFYAERDGSLVFGTNLAAAVGGLGNAAEVDRSLEDFLLIYGFLPYNRVPFKHVRSLGAGTMLEWRAGRATTSRIESSPAWTEGVPGDFSGMSFDDAVDGLYEVFMRAMEQQAASAPDAAVMLGGFDSGLVAAGLVRLGKRVRTYSYGFGDVQFDQPHTDTLAQHLGIDHRWVRMDANVLRDGLAGYGHRFSAPSNWANYLIQSDVLCRAIREDGTTFCYTGDGCDNIFMGFPRVYGRAHVYDRIGRLPPRAAAAVLAAMRPAVWERMAGHPYRVMLNVVRTMAGSWPAGRFLTFRVFDEFSLERLRDDHPPQERALEAILQDLTRGLEGVTPARLAYLGKNAIGTNRTKIIGCSDGNGIAILSPYLHPAVRTFAQRIPDAFVRPGSGAKITGSGKYILMEMAERKRLLPAEFIRQRKISAVDAPVDEWYFGPLKGFATDRLKALPFRARPEYVAQLFRPKLAERAYRRFVSSDHVTTHGISLLATYAALAELVGPARPG